MATQNEESLKVGIVELQSQVEILTNIIEQMQHEVMKSSQSQQSDPYIHYQTFDANSWDICSPFGDQSLVSVFVEESFGKQRQCHPLLTWCGGTVTVSFDRAVQGYAVIVPMIASMGYTQQPNFISPTPFLPIEPYLAEELTTQACSDSTVLSTEPQQEQTPIADHDAYDHAMKGFK